MRMKSLIDSLTHIVEKGVIFPTEETSFDNFMSMVKIALHQNFGSVIEEDSIGWDSSSQRIYFTVLTHLGRLHGTGVTADRAFRINPKLPMLGEFQRVEQELASFAEECQRMRKALGNAGLLFEP